MKAPFTIDYDDLGLYNEYYDMTNAMFICKLWTYTVYTAISLALVTLLIAGPGRWFMKDAVHPSSDSQWNVKRANYIIYAVAFFLVGMLLPGIFGDFKNAIKTRPSPEEENSPFTQNAGESGEAVKGAINSLLSWSFGLAVYAQLSNAFVFIIQGAPTAVLLIIGWELSSARVSSMRKGLPMRVVAVLACQIVVLAPMLQAFAVIILYQGFSVPLWVFFSSWCLNMGML